MNLIAVAKLLKKAKEIHDYVKKPNNLDQQNEMMLIRLDKLEKNITSLESKMNNLNAAIKKDIEKIKNVKKR